MSVRLLLSRLADIGDFLRWQKRFASVEGFLADLEGYALLLLASSGPGIGEVVELGSYLGRSTAFLAAGSKTAGRRKSPPSTISVARRSTRRVSRTRAVS